MELTVELIVELTVELIVTLREDEDDNATELLLEELMVALGFS